MMTREDQSIHISLDPIQGEKEDITRLSTVHHSQSPADMSVPECQGRDIDRHTVPEKSKHADGLAFLALTIGLMAVVLMVAMDNYIIGVINNPADVSIGEEY